LSEHEIRGLTFPATTEWQPHIPLIENKSVHRREAQTCEKTGRWGKRPRRGANIRGSVQMLLADGLRHKAPGGIGMSAHRWKNIWAEIILSINNKLGLTEGHLNLSLIDKF
jgi:hypothetical protein